MAGPEEELDFSDDAGVLYQGCVAGVEELRGGTQKLGELFDRLLAMHEALIEQHATLERTSLRRDGELAAAYEHIADLEAALGPDAPDVTALLGRNKELCRRVAELEDRLAKYEVVE